MRRVTYASAAMILFAVCFAGCAKPKPPPPPREPPPRVLSVALDRVSLRTNAYVELHAWLAAAGVTVWNPFVVERLALGQWALLTSYAALPWLLRALAHPRDGTMSGVGPVVGWAALASPSRPTPTFPCSTSERYAPAIRSRCG